MKTGKTKGNQQVADGTCEQVATVADEQKGTERGQKNRLPKTSPAYWKSRLRQREYIHAGKRHLIPEWQIRFKEGGRQVWFNLQTPNRDAAGVKARDIYLYLAANGLDATVARFKAPEGTPRGKLTVGQFLDAVKATGRLRPATFQGYANCLQTIVAEVFGIKSSGSRFDYRTGGNGEWVNRIRSVRLDRLTSTKVEAWRVKRIKAAGNSPVALASAQRTLNSYIRCARSLFSTKKKGEAKSLLDLVKRQLGGVELPSPLPFADVGMYETGSMKYVSRINAAALVAAAKNELAQSNPEAFKLIVLGLMAGLRKQEIDLLEWSMVDLANSQISLRETEWLHLKSDSSESVVKLDAEVVALFKQWKRTAEGRFVVRSPRRPRNDTVRPYYRCKPVFKFVYRWLRSKGVKVNKPLHELRKEVGSVIANRDGIYAASAFLRHGDIQITAAHYADAAKKSSGLGSLLAATEITVAKVG